MALGTLTVDLIAQTASFNANIEKAARTLNENSTRMNRSLDSVKKNMAAVRAGAEAFALGFAIGETAKFVKANLDMVGSLGETAQQLGVTTRELQVFRAIGGQVGVTQEDMDKALSKLTVSMGKAALGAKGQSEAFQALGVNVRDSSGHVKGAGTVIGEIADKLSKIQDPAQRAAAEVAIFGKAGQKLDTVMTGGAKSIDEYAKRAEQMGMVLSDDVISKADNAADKIEELNTQLRANIANKIAQNSGAILNMANALVSLTSASVEFIDKYPRLAAALAGAAAGARFGGAQGAIIGAGLGVVAGDFMSGGNTDESMDLKVRMQALRDAQATQADRLKASRSGSLLSFRKAHGNEQPGTLEDATKEVWRQTQLLQQATAKALSPKPKPSPNVNLPDFLGSDGGETRTNSQIMADFKAELAKRGIGVVPGEVRTAAQQNALYKQGITPLDGYQNVSRHQSGQAIDFNRASFNEQKVREAAQAAGLKGFELVTESGGRKHAEWTGAGKPGDLDGFFKSQQEAAREAVQAAKEAQRDQEQYQNSLDGLNNDLLSAKADNVTDASALVQIAKEQIDAEATRLKHAIDADAATNPIIKAHSDELKAIVDRVAVQKKLTIDTEEFARQIEESADRQMAINDNEITFKQIQESLATTAADRRKLALDILALEKEQVRIKAQETIDLAKIGKATKQQAEEAQRTLDTLDRDYAVKAEGVKRSNAGPIDSYLNSLPRTAAEMNEALESVAVKGLQGVEDGLLSIIDGTKSVAGAFRDMASSIISDLLRLSIQQSITIPLANMLGLGGGLGGSVGNMMGPSVSGGGGFLSQLLGIGKMFAGSISGGLGGVSSSSMSALSGIESSLHATTLANMGSFAMPISFRAAGGMITGPGTGTSDSIPAMLSNGEYVLNAQAVRRLGKAHLDMINKGVSAPKFARGGMAGRYQGGTANDNGSPVTIHLSMQASGNPKADRQSAMQAASVLRSEIGKSAKRGY